MKTHNEAIQKAQRDANRNNKTMIVWQEKHSDDFGRITEYYTTPAEFYYDNTIITEEEYICTVEPDAQTEQTELIYSLIAPRQPIPQTVKIPTTHKGAPRLF